MRRSLTIAAGAVLLASCTADTMRGYVGQDIRAVELAYGPPSNQIDLGGGTRAFQWTRVSVDTTPVTATSTTERDSKGRKTTETQYTGGDTSVTTSVYTFLTTWDAPRNGWIVTGIREPALECAIGGLS